MTLFRVSLLVGNSLKSSLVAIIAVDHDALKTWAATEGIEVNNDGLVFCSFSAKPFCLAFLDIFDSLSSMKI